jgi:hypothetical protein
MQTDSTPTASDPRRRPRWRTLAATTVALAAATLLVAGCGGGSGTGSPKASPSDGLLAYSECMRSHGVTNYPDPNSQGVIEGQDSSGSGSSGMDPNSPIYKAAQQACQKYVSGVTTPANEKQRLTQALEYTTCMRSHGVTDFPDPQDVNGQISFPGQGGVGRTPHFQSANTACQHYLTQGG